MMQFDFTNDHLYLYNEVKFWVSVGGLMYTLLKGFNWVKDIREKDLKSISSDVTAVSTEVRSQTGVIGSGFNNLSAVMDSGLSELRSDFRTFYTQPDPIMVPVHARQARKRSSVAKRTAAKAKPAQKAKAKPKAKK